MPLFLYKTKIEKKYFSSETCTSKPEVIYLNLSLLSKLDHLLKLITKMYRVALINKIDVIKQILEYGAEKITNMGFIASVNGKF